jgi:D-alanyl-D-alanine carboxypeptidase (penicillin-binding protein 5/6)
MFVTGFFKSSSFVKITIKSVMLLAIFVVGSASSFAQTIDTPAKYAILLDAETGTVLFEKNADTPFPPASMSKLMTTYVAFDMITNGTFALDDTTTVSTDVWRKWRGQGSTMFLNANDEVTIEQLLKGIIIQSGNDACVVLAEAMAGTEEAYVQWMNAAATEMGLQDSHFVNTNGWPEEGQVMSARDLATLAQNIVNEFPELYKIYSERSYAYGIDSSSGREINQRNRNPILGRVEGGDGLKTGHTEESGYSLTASAERDGRRLVMVVSGLQSERSRSREGQRLLEYGFRNFKTYHMFTAGQVIDVAEVWLGAETRVPMVVEQPVTITMSRFDRARMTATLVYDSPIPAPIKTGQAIAHIRISVPEKDDIIVPLLAGSDIESLGGFGKISAAFAHMLFGASQ